MTPQERLMAFQQEYRLLSEKYGWDFAAVAEGKQLGPVVQIEPKLTIIVKEGWVEPPAEKELPITYTAQKPSYRNRSSKRK